MKSIKVRKLTIRTRRSKLLERLTEADDRLQEYKYDINHDAPHWIYLHWPYVCYDLCIITAHTVKEAIEQIRDIELGCDSCGRSFHECCCPSEDEEPTEE